MKKLIIITVPCLYIVGHVFGMVSHLEDGKIPFTILHHMILVKAKIDDSSVNYNFIIDTGGLTFIDKKVVKELGLKERGPMAKITTLNLAGYQIENVFCFKTFDFNIFRRSGIPIHGIIGSNLMERFKVTFDFQSSFVIFSSDTTSLTQPGSGLLLPFRNHPVNNAPIINFKVNQKTIEGMIDTGQTYPVVFPLDDFEKYKTADLADAIYSKGVIVKWPQTTPTHNILSRLNSLELNHLKLTNTICVFAELPPLLSMPLIGTELLFQFNMIINYPKDELLLIQNPDFNIKKNRYSLGMSIDLTEENEAVIEGIWENSPADKANIHVGDKLIRFNSKEITSSNLAELLEMMHNDNISSIHITVNNQNGRRDIKLEKVMLF